MLLVMRWMHCFDTSLGHFLEQFIIVKSTSPVFTFLDQLCLFAAGCSGWKLCGTTPYVQFYGTSRSFKYMRV